MEGQITGIIGLGLLALLLALGVHIAVALATVGFVGMILVSGFHPALWSMGTTIYYRIGDYSMVTIPLFVMMGFIAAGGGISDKLYDVGQMWTGKLRSGLAIATVLGCTGFGAVCGSSLVTASVFAKLSAPAMRAHGYEKKIAYGTCAAAGMIGMLIPPSTLIVLYCIISGDSIGKLLIAGTAPGLLLTIAFSAGLIVISKIKPEWMATTPPKGVTWRRRFTSLVGLWPVFVVALTIFGGIFGGVLNATEAAAAATFVMVIILFILRGRASFKHLAASLSETVTISAMLFLILGGALVFSHFLVLSGTTGWITDSIMALGLGKLSLLFAVAGLYLILGCFLDAASMISITIPLLHPLIVIRLGVDPIWFAMIVILAVEIGLLTPPVGLNVYGTQAVAEADVSIEDVFAGSMPFFFIALVALVLVIVFPALTTTLPSLMISGS